MKLLLTLIVLVTSCAMTKKPALPIEPSPKPVETDLAWGVSHPEWDIALLNAIKAQPLKDVRSPCPKSPIDVCFAHLVSIMAKYESNFKPETTYKESFKDSKGKPVISRGLLQLSIESANQKAYACGIKKAEDLHDPKTNLECAVKIIKYQASKSGTLIDGNRGGCSSYWSVCRLSSGSYKKIMDYLAKH